MPARAAGASPGVAGADALKFENAAHWLKGSVANFGASAAVDAAFRLEQIGSAGQWSKRPRLWTRSKKPYR